MQSKYQEGRPLCLIVHNTVMITLYLLYPYLLSRGSVVTTPEAAEDVYPRWFVAEYMQ